MEFPRSLVFNVKGWVVRMVDVGDAFLVKKYCFTYTEFLVGA